MLYEKLMMDNSTLTRFNLFRRILSIKENYYPVALLANEMNVSYQHMMIEMTEINHELQMISSDQVSILGRAGKILTDKITVTIDDYRYFLLSHSVSFQYILYMLNEENPTIEHFCETHEVSRSTVSRKMQHLKRHLKQFNLRFTYNEAGIVGDERLIRLALFNICWLGTRGMEWPFTAVSEEDAETFVACYSDYFPPYQSYLGRLEMKYFAAIILSRIKKNKFVKYDRYYNILMSKNAYYDFDRFPTKLVANQEVTAKEFMAESAFIFLLSQITPFYKDENDPSLQQTFAAFTKRKNLILPLVENFLTEMKRTIFADQPEVLDNPVIIGNLLNITFATYVFRQAFPSIYRLVMIKLDQGAAATQLENEIGRFFTRYRQENKVIFINDETQSQIVAMFKNALLPAYDSIQYSNHLHVALALEENFLLMQGLQQFLNDLRFVTTETYAQQNRDQYDIVVSSSQLLKKQNPELDTYLWDYAADETQYIDLYQKLKSKFSQRLNHLPQYTG